MKQIRISKLITIMICTGAFLTGCDNAEYNAIDNVIYIQESKTQAYVSLKVPIRNVDLTVSLTPCAGQVMPEDTEIQVGVSETGLEAFNKKNGTSYVLLPQEGYSVKSENVTIKQGELNASAIQITFKPMTAEMKKSGKTYALPVSITSAGAVKTLKGADMLVYVMDPLKTISVPIIKRSNNLNMKMRQDYQLKEWTVEYRISIDKLGTEIGQFNNQALFTASAPDGVDGEIYTRFGDAPIEGNRLQIKTQGSQMNSNMLFNMDTWYHIAFVNDGAKLTLYVNGVKDSEMTTKGETTSLSKDKFSFGSTEHYLVANIKVSELRFWTKAVSQTQIQNNMFNVNPETDGLEAYWRLNEGEGNEFNDFTGHGNLGKSTGITQWIHNILADNKPDSEVDNAGDN